MVWSSYSPQIPVGKEPLPQEDDVRLSHMRSVYGLYHVDIELSYPIVFSVALNIYPKERFNLELREEQTR